MALNFEQDYYVTYIKYLIRFPHRQVQIAHLDSLQPENKSALM